MTAFAAMSVSAGAVDAHRILASAAPGAWVAYAETANATIIGWLKEATPEAAHIRMLLATRNSSGPAEPFMISIRIARTGRITQIDCDNNDRSDIVAGLRYMLQNKILQPPPRRMRQPVLLALDVENIQLKDKETI